MFVDTNVLVNSRVAGAARRTTTPPGQAWNALFETPNH